jgi:hypothetical protein
LGRIAAVFTKSMRRPLAAYQTSVAGASDVSKPDSAISGSHRLGGPNLIGNCIDAISEDFGMAQDEPRLD